MTTARVRFSVVMPNYNYRQFIAAAVDSALALDWPDVEVIVVDDGSTDDSVEVLKQFGDRITVLTQPNSGPRVACNIGFAASTGDIVIFLDSDDQLETSLAREVMAVWHPAVSKVQVQMQRIDSSGRPIGGVFPDFHGAPTPEQVREWLIETGAYPTPPGSGNAYSRSFLEQLFPLGDDCGDATDSACLAAAPILGDVITIPKPLVRYRIHDGNRSKLSDPVRFTRQIERAYQRQTFALGLSDRPSDTGAVVRSLRRGSHLLQMRIAERRLNRGSSPVPSDSYFRQIRDAGGSLFTPGPESWKQRVMVFGWCIVTLGAPPAIARVLISWRFR